MSLHKRLLGLVLILYLSNTTLDAGWGGMKYHEYTTHMIDDIYEVFIKNKICTDRNRDCQSKELILSQQAAPNIYLSIYSFKDLEILDEVIKIVIDEYTLAQNNGDTDLSIHLTVFERSHVELREIGFFDGLFNDHHIIDLSIRGEEK